MIARALAMLALAGCADDPAGPLAIEIFAPADDQTVGADPIPVRFTMTGNTIDELVTVTAGTSAETLLVQRGVARGTVWIDPGADTGELWIVAEAGAAWADVLVTWTAPWQAYVWRCETDACHTLGDEELAGEERLVVEPAWDPSRLDHAELTIDGAPVDDLDPLPAVFRVDTTAFSNGAATLAATAVRDDGERATVTRSVIIAN